MTLLDHRDAVLRSVQGSTCAVDYPELIPWLELRLEAASGRAESAPDRSAERSERIRSAVRRAIQSLPLMRPELELVEVARARLSKLEVYGLNRVPGRRLILDEIRKLRRSRTEATQSTGLA